MAIQGYGAARLRATHLTAPADRLALDALLEGLTERADLVFHYADGDVLLALRVDRPTFEALCLLGADVEDREEDEAVEDDDPAEDDGRALGLAGIGTLTAEDRP